MDNFTAFGNNPTDSIEKRAKVSITPYKFDNGKS